jgi:deazaflavin-dependent oxidoreductase (nitroreductase family)
MAKTYRLGRGTRLVNALFQTMTRLGLGASYRHILTVPGRKTGRLHSTPVDIIQVSGQRWLVAGYGPAGWVRNARAAGEVTLSRGRDSRRFEIEEADGPTAVPVLREYMTEIRVTRAYFDATPIHPTRRWQRSFPDTQSSVSSPGPQLTGHYWTLAHTSRRKVASC